MRAARWMRSRGAGWLLLAVAAALITAGALRGEVALVLQKSVTICMECIGLG